MPATYEPIATTTLSSTASSVVFDSIPQTYTDLVVVFNGLNTTATTAMTGEFDLNNDGGNNYSSNAINLGPTASRGVGNNGGYYGTLYNSSVCLATIHFMNYSNTTTFKNWLSRTSFFGPANGNNAILGQWRNTAAITKIDFNRPAGEPGSFFEVGSTWTLYGIKAA